MAERSEFGKLIEERCAALGIASQADLRRLLLRRGCTASANTISSWHIRSRPRAGRLSALLDVLELHGAARDRAHALANALEVDDDPVPGDPPSDPAAPALDPEGRVVTPPGVERGLDGGPSDLSVERFTLSDVA